MMMRFCFTSIFFLSLNGFAQAVSSEDLQVQQVAKARSYPGGSDQEPLQVQAQLPSVSRKMHPAQEPVEIPDESPEPSGND